MNRITRTIFASCIALATASAMAQAGGGSGGGGGPGLASPDSGATQQKPATSGTGPTNPNGTTTLPNAAQGSPNSGGNLSGGSKSSGAAMNPDRKSNSSKKGAVGNTQGTGQAQTPSPQ